MKTKMNLKTTLFSFLLAFILFSCKKENTFSDFKYKDKPAILTCDNLNSKLYQEALYTFEDDLLNFYKRNNANSTLAQSYSQFIRNSIYGRIKYEDIISEHTYKVFEALKDENDLWDANNQKSHLNYKSAIITCMANNIKDVALKTTFNSLISTNFMDPKLFGSPLMAKYTNTLSDKFLATYVALDLFYAKLFDIDFSNVNFEKPQPIDFNVIPPKTPSGAPIN